MNDADDLIALIVKLQMTSALNLNYVALHAEHVGELARMPKLRRLSLRETGLGDVALRDLAKIVSLEYLDLGGNDVGDGNLRLLGQLPKLREFNLVDTGVSRASAIEFKAIAPKCTVIIGSSDAAEEI